MNNTENQQHKLKKNLQLLNSSLINVRVTMLTCFSDDHAAVITQLGEQPLESSCPWCSLRWRELSGHGGLQDDCGGNLCHSQICACFTVDFLITRPLSRSSAAVSPARMMTAVITAASIALAVVFTVEMLLPSCARTLRITLCLPPSLVLRTLLFYRHSGATPKVPL